MNTQVVLTVVDGLIPRVEHLAKTKMNHNQHRETTKQPPRITEQPKHTDIHHYRPSNEQRSKTRGIQWCHRRKFLTTVLHVHVPQNPFSHKHCRYPKRITSICLLLLY